MQKSLSVSKHQHVDGTKKDCSIQILTVLTFWKLGLAFDFSARGKWV